MQPVTLDDRKKELKVLLQQMQEQPSRDWSTEKERVAVLNQMIAADDHASTHAQQQG